MAIDFSVLSRGITCTPNYHGSIRNTVVQHINDYREISRLFLPLIQIFIYLKFINKVLGMEKLKFRHLRKFKV